MFQRSTLPGQVFKFAQKWRGLLVDQPTLDPHAAFVARHLGANAGVFCRAAECSLVHIGQMGEIKQVVGDQKIVGRVVQIARSAAPPRVVQVVRVGNERGIRLVGVAHPYPDPFEPFDHRICAHFCGRRNELLRGNLYAFAGPVKQQSVIHAANIVALAPPLRQGRRAVTASVIERHHPARAVAPQ